MFSITFRNLMVIGGNCSFRAMLSLEKKPKEGEFELIHGKTMGWFTRRLTEMERIRWEPIPDTFRVVARSKPLLGHQTEKFDYFIMLRRKQDGATRRKLF